MAACIFCEIIAGRIPAAIVWQDEHTVAFLDTRPLFPGHVLLVPREHADTLTDLPAATLPVFFDTLQRLAKAVPEALGATGTFVANNNIVSQSVPHLHFHVVPRHPKDGLKGFFWPRTEYKDSEHVEQVRAKIAAAMA